MLKIFTKKDINTIRLQTKLESWNYYDYNLFSNQSLSFVNNDFNVIDKKVEYIHMIKIIMFQDYRSKNYLISPKKMNVMSSILSTAIKFKDKLQIKNNKVIKLFEANYFIFENLKNYIEEKNLDFYKSSFINFKGDISKMNGENIINHDNIQRNIKIIFKKKLFR
ncbi:hypothetical protein NPX79_02855 [Spiroplasma endosymbiont of Anurida maritima]|uniref:hypothetical protein n=1 Tax=Spiroplasma endosymbiont of Anurida maritima TaxID=2967972 RepID=UPI0036D3E928